MAGNVGDVMAVVFKKKSAHKKKSYSLLNGLFFEPFISYTLSNFGSPLATAMILSSSSSPSIIWIIPFYYRKSPPNYHFKMILFLSFLPTNNSSIDECQGRYFLTAENKNIKRISISSHSLWNEPIMRRIMHGSVKNSIEFDQSRTIDFKLSTRSFWDFNQRCHILRCVATWGDVIRRVCPKALFRHEIHFDQAAFLLLIVARAFSSWCSRTLSSNVTNNWRRSRRCLGAFPCWGISWSGALAFICLDSKNCGEAQNRSKSNNKILLSHFSYKLDTLISDLFLFFFELQLIWLSDCQSRWITLFGRVIQNISWLPNKKIYFYFNKVLVQLFEHKSTFSVKLIKESNSCVSLQKRIKRITF